MSVSFNKREAAYWGKFIEVANTMYDSGEINPPQPANFPKGWRLIKNIQARVVIGPYSQKEFIGFVGQSNSHPKQFVMALHGSRGPAVFFNNLQYKKVDFKLIPNGGRTVNGFLRYYKYFSFVDPKSGHSQTLLNHLKSLRKQQPFPSFTLTGFSLGGALATLHATVLASRKIPVRVYTFASPMVGDETFVKRFNELVPVSHRIVNKMDVVPNLPGEFMGYKHVNGHIEINSLDFPKVKKGLTCFHKLPTYLHVLGDSTIDLGSCQK